MKPFKFPDFPDLPPAGATPVNRIDALSRIERSWLRTYRLWGGGAQDRVTLCEELVLRHGEGRARRILALTGDFMDLLAQHARRPLTRHGEACDCVGADEAAVVLMCSTATSGEREDAMMVACLVLRPDVAPIAVSLAQTLGLEMAREGGSGRLH